MPKLGMEPIRRDALVKATIAEVGVTGSLDVTVARIARRAGVSPGLAHHYFGGKDDLLFAAMRHILGLYGASVRAELARARTPRDRLAGIIRASFGPDNFEPEVIAAWLSFYVHAQSDPGARRLLGIYQARLGSNLTSALLQARSGELTSQETVLLLQDLTDELRHIARSSSRDERNLNQILAELRQRVQHRLGHGGIALAWDVDPQLPVLANGEAGQHVRAILSEAIANVVKHARASRISLSAREDNKRVEIELSDNGVGFDPAAVETGRGLPGMRQRAQAIGGALNLESRPAGGSRWRLSLPALRA